MALTEADVRVREEVRGQLDWDPDVDSSAIGVVAKNGIITLATGSSRRFIVRRT